PSSIRGPRWAARCTSRCRAPETRLTAQARGTRLARVGYVERHLLADERVRYKTRLHWVLYLKPLLVTLFGVGMTVALALMPDPPWLWYLGLAVTVAGALWWAARWIELRTSGFAG